ncbi:hypothetical protein GCM10023340_17880 [Nocardioides marinquilinus]|uniref:Uncharacterized protein n=1 Tax=Nocardioides marinquilinus TaxID=1210400 RepID=A0ABP9PHI7_9ACTN
MTTDDAHTRDVLAAARDLARERARRVALVEEAGVERDAARARLRAARDELASLTEEVDRLRGVGGLLTAVLGGRGKRLAVLEQRRAAVEGAIAEARRRVDETRAEVARRQRAVEEFDDAQPRLEEATRAREALLLDSDAEVAPELRMVVGRIAATRRARQQLVELLHETQRVLSRLQTAHSELRDAADRAWRERTSMQLQSGSSDPRWSRHTQPKLEHMRAAAAQVASANELLAGLRERLERHDLTPVDVPLRTGREPLLRLSQDSRLRRWEAMGHIAESTDRVAEAVGPVAQLAADLEHDRATLDAELRSLTTRRDHLLS